MKYVSAIKDIIRSDVQTDQSFGDSEITFYTEEEYYKVAARPEPSYKFFPQWYKDLESQPEQTSYAAGASVKACRPFFDALSIGWIVPLPFDVEIYYDGERFDSACKIENYSLNQKDDWAMDGFEKNDQPVIQIPSIWTIDVPDGYSIMQTHPTNRFNTPIFALTGIVDADIYNAAFNGGHIWTGGEYHGVLRAGTPVTQLIPIKRDTLIKTGKIEKLSNEKRDEVITQQMQNNAAISPGHYTKNQWQPNKTSRNISGCPFSDKER